MRIPPALFPLCLALSLPGCSAPPPAHAEFAPLLSAIEKRLALARSVARHKWQNDLPVQASAREAQVLVQVRAAASDYGLSPARAADFFSDQIEANKLIQYGLLDRWRTLGQAPETPARDLISEIRPRLDQLQATLLFELARLDQQPPAECALRLNESLSRRSREPLQHLALVRATANVCQTP